LASSERKSEGKMRKYSYFKQLQVMLIGRKESARLKERWKAALSDVHVSQ
jgi:hypothetical protein